MWYSVVCVSVLKSAQACSAALLYVVSVLQASDNSTTSKSLVANDGQNCVDDDDDDDPQSFSETYWVVTRTAADAAVHAVSSVQLFVNSFVEFFPLIIVHSLVNFFHWRWWEIK